MVERAKEVPMVGPKGENLFVPESEVEEKFQQGWAVRKGTRISIRDPSGTPGNVPAEEYMGLLRTGWSSLGSQAHADLRDEQDFGGFGAEVRNVARGAISGATVGLISHQQLTLGQTEEATRKEIERNPIALGIGEVVGFVGPALLSGGTSVAAKGAGLLPAALLAKGGLKLEAKIAGKLAGAAPGAARGLGSRIGGIAGAAGAENVVFEAGQVVNEAVFENRGLTAEAVGERLYAAGKDGALFGAGLGAGFGALRGSAKAVNAGVRRLVNAVDGIGTADATRQWMGLQIAGGSKEGAQRIMNRFGRGDDSWRNYVDEAHALGYLDGSPAQRMELSNQNLERFAEDIKGSLQTAGENGAEINLIGLRDSIETDVLSKLDDNLADQVRTSLPQIFQGATKKAKTAADKVAFKASKKTEDLAVAEKKRIDNFDVVENKRAGKAGDRINAAETKHNRAQEALREQEGVLNDLVVKQGDAGSGTKLSVKLIASSEKNVSDLETLLLKAKGDLDVARNRGFKDAIPDVQSKIRKLTGQLKAENRSLKKMTKDAESAATKASGALNAQVKAEQRAFDSAEKRFSKSRDTLADLRHAEDQAVKLSATEQGQRKALFKASEDVRLKGPDPYANDPSVPSADVMTPTDLWEVRKLVDGKWAWRKDEASNGLDLAMRELRHPLEDAIQNALDAAAKKSGVGDVLTKYNKAKRGYQVSVTTRDLSAKTISSEAGQSGKSLASADAAIKTAFGAALLATGGMSHALGWAMLSGQMRKLVSGVGQEAGFRSISATQKWLRAEGWTNQVSKRAVDATKSFLKAKGTSGIIQPIRFEAHFRMGRAEAYEEKRAEYGELASNPEMIQAKMEAGLAELAEEIPETAALAAGKVQNQVQVIASLMPKENNQSALPNPLFEDTQRISDRERNRWLRQVLVIERPETFTELLSGGNLQRPDVVAFQQARPAEYAMVVENVNETLAQAEAQPTRDQLFQLSVLTGQPFHNSMLPNRVASFQTQYALREEEIATDIPSPSRRNQPKTAAAHLTKSQKLSVTGSEIA